MLTYVINTSENKTFECERLFSLVGYNKIRWKSCRLDEINKCAQEIYDSQNSITASRFQIAVIVDFYNFDRIREPYGASGYSKPETGVDLVLYFPFIEAYLSDNLFDWLARKNVFVEKRDIYYIQNKIYETLDNIQNAEEQVHYILKPVKIGNDSEKMFEDISEKDLRKLENDRNEKTHILKSELDNSELIKKRPELKKLRVDEFGYIEFNKYTEEDLQKKEEDYVPYKRYELYCSDKVRLVFNTSDYPYGGGEFVNFHDFYQSISQRSVNVTKIHRHYYYNNGNVTSIHSAFDNLTLSLFLIQMYEQEQDSRERDEVIVDTIDSERLITVLVQSWNKVRKAKEASKQNDSRYFDIKKYADKETREIEDKKEDDTKPSIKNSISEYAEKLKYEAKDKKSVEQLYQMICDYASHKKNQMTKQDKERLSKIFKEYFDNRDNTREMDVESQFEQAQHDGEIETTNQCPNKMIYDQIKESKENEISEVFKKALDSEYVVVDYSNEKKRADKVMDSYKELKRIKTTSKGGQIFLTILVNLIVVIPYMLLERRPYGYFSIPSIIQYLIIIAVVTGLLILGFTIQRIAFERKIFSIRNQMFDIYYSCLKKSDNSLGQISERYKTDLLFIEKARYKIRFINYLHQKNNEIDFYVKKHQRELTKLENNLSAMLNNLGVEPTINNDVNITTEFFINEPINSPNNKVYKVFTIDTIDDLFDKKGDK